MGTDASNDPYALLWVANVSSTFYSFYRGHIAHLISRGFVIRLAADHDHRSDEKAQDLGAPLHHIQMPRAITPVADLRALWRLIALMRQFRPDVVHAHTPKGGLLGMLAARVVGVPTKFYTCLGIPYLSKSGWRRWLLKATERISCRLADRVICVSESNRQVLIEDGLCPAEKATVIGSGGVCGADAQRFSPREEVRKQAAALRRQLGIPPSCTALGFIGRFTRDKGITELLGAWQQLRVDLPTLHLLLVGCFEPGDPLPPEVEQRLRSEPGIHVVGWQWDTPPWYSAMDVFVLPTYREGLPISALEAAAMELPVVATRVPGCVDAVVDGRTGLLVPPRDAEALAGACRRLLDDPGLRQKLGRQGRQRVLSEFAPERISEGLRQEYLAILGQRTH